MDGITNIGPLILDAIVKKLCEEWRMFCLESMNFDEVLLFMALRKTKQEALLHYHILVPVIGIEAQAVSAHFSGKYFFVDEQLFQQIKQGV